MLGGYEFPAAWFQSVPAVWVLVCAPLLANLWMWLAAKGRDLSVILKFALGLAGMGFGFLVMVGAAEGGEPQSCSAPPAMPARCGWSPPTCCTPWASCACRPWA